MFLQYIIIKPSLNMSDNHQKSNLLRYMATIVVIYYGGENILVEETRVLST